MTSQQLHYPAQTFLHCRQFHGGDGGERAFAEAIFIQRAGLVGDDLAGFQQAAPRGQGNAPPLEHRVNFGGQRQNHYHWRDVFV